MNRLTRFVTPSRSRRRRGSRRCRFILIEFDLVLRNRPKVEQLELARTVALNRGDAVSLVERDLPDSRQVREQVSNEFTRLRIPHLERPVRTRDDLVLVVLETGDRALVSVEGVTTFSRLGVPDAEGPIGGGTDEAASRESEESNERRVSVERVQLFPGLDRPEFDRPVHRSRRALFPMMIEYDRVDFERMTLENVFAFTREEVPNSNVVVVGSRNNGPPRCRDGSNGVTVP